MLAAISGSGNLAIGVTNGNVVTLLAVNTFTGTTTVGSSLSGGGTFVLVQAARPARYAARWSSIPVRW